MTIFPSRSGLILSAFFVVSPAWVFTCGQRTGQQYGRFVVGADVKAKAISHMPFVMYLPRICQRAHAFASRAMSTLRPNKEISYAWLFIPDDLVSRG
ncbi:hypothetical protein V4E86_14135 [Burkholderia pseudomallei]